MYTDLVRTEHIDILLSTFNSGLFIPIQNAEDRKVKEEYLLRYLREHVYNDPPQLAVIYMIDPVFSDIATALHRKLIDYNFYDLENGFITISSVQILTMYTVLIRFEWNKESGVICGK